MRDLVCRELILSRLRLRRVHAGRDTRSGAGSRDPGVK